MIEVKEIEENEKPNKDGFYKGKFVGDQEMRTIGPGELPTSSNVIDLTQEQNDLTQEQSSLREVIEQGVKDAIAADAQELKEYDKSFCDNGCCSTAIGAPITGASVTVSKQRQRVFDSGLKVIEMHNGKIPIDIPREILNACDELQAHVGHNEFSIVCKGKWSDDGNYKIDNDYKVPKQKVEGAAVDYDLTHLEELKLEGYNTVIHSHPFKSEAFSSSDKETINSHFECSVLYSLRDFTTATIAISPVSGVKLIAKGDPIVEGQNLVPKTELNNIEKKYNTDFARRDQWWYGAQPNFSNSGKQGHGKRNDRDCECGCGGARSRSGLLSREITTHEGRNTYTYDAKTDTLWKDGKPVDDFNRAKLRNQIGKAVDFTSNQKPIHIIGTDTVRVQQIPRALPSRDPIFKVSQTRVFDSGAGNVEEQQKGGKKSKGNKKDHQQKTSAP